MEVRDVFAMRKEGRVEEAYKAISEIYATHHGPHTNLCMFWCASDMLKLRAKEKNADEARRLLGLMVKIYPTIKDDDGRAARAVSKGALAMDKLREDFNLVYFMPWFNKLTDEDWKPYTVDNHRVPSLGQQIVNHLMSRLGDRDASYIEQVSELFRKALQLQPAYKENLRHLAQMHALLSQSDKAIEVYKRLLRRHHDSYLYGELAGLVSDDTQKTALLCQAIMNQRREEFRAKYHLELALLLMRLKLMHRAAYELRRCVAIRQKYGHPLTPFIQRQADRLKDVQPVSDTDEQALYIRSKAVVDGMLG